MSCPDMHRSLGSVPSRGIFALFKLFYHLTCIKRVSGEGLGGACGMVRRFKAKDLKMGRYLNKNRSVICSVKGKYFKSAWPPILNISCISSITKSTLCFIY